MLSQATLDYVESVHIKADIAKAVARNAREGLCLRCGGRRSVARLAMIPNVWQYQGHDVVSPPTPGIVDFPCPKCCGVPLPPRMELA